MTSLNIKGIVKGTSEIKLSVYQAFTFTGVTDKYTLVAPTIGYYALVDVCGLLTDEVDDFDFTNIYGILSPHFGVFFIITDISQGIFNELFDI